MPLDDVGNMIVGGALFVGGGIAALTFSPFVGFQAMNIGLTMFLSGLKGTPTVNAQGIQANAAGTDESLMVVYGFTKVGGAIHETHVDPSSDNREFLARGVSFCVASENGQGIDDIVRVWFDDTLAIDQDDANGYRSLLNNETAAQSDGVQEFYEGKLEYGLWDGADDNPVDPTLNSRFPTRWPSSSKPQRVANGNFFLEWDENVYSGFPRITAKIRGNQIWDPRLGPRSDNANWQWSDNPALCLLDYLLSDFYGCQFKESQIDIQSFIDAANYCEENASANTKQRFTCNGALDTGNRLIENINSLLSSCRGELVYRNGQYALIIRQATTTVDFELDETNIIGGWKWLRSGSKNAPNSIVARFIDYDNPQLEQETWVNDEVAWPETGGNNFLVSDNDVPQAMNMELPLTNNYFMAQQLAMVVLKESREDTTVEVTCRESALQLQVGDLVSVTHPTPGWSNKEFWVKGMTITEDQNVSLVLREYSDLAYSLDPQSDQPTVPGSTLPNPYSIPNPTDLTLSSGDPTAIEHGDGTKTPRILAAWIIPNPTEFFHHAEVRIRPITDADNNPIAASEWQRMPDVGIKDTIDTDFSDGISQQLYIGHVKNQFEYEVQVRSVNNLEYASDWVSSNQIASITGEQSPLILLETEEDQGTGTGTISATVIDPAGGTLTVEFFEKIGPGTFPSTAAQTNVSVSSGSTVTYDTTLDIERSTYVRVVATIDSNGNQNSQTAVLDWGLIAEVLNLNASVDDDSHEIVVSVDADTDTEKVYITAKAGDLPADPTTTANDAVIDGNVGTAATGVVLEENERGFVKARGWNSTSGLSSIIRRAITTVGAHGTPIILADTYEGTSTGSVDVTAVDPDGGSLKLEFFERQGNNSAYGSAVQTLNGISSGSQHTETIGLVEGKNSWIKARATVEATGKSAEREFAFDPDKVAEVNTLSATISVAGEVIVSAGGDVDTEKIYVTAGTGTAEYPTRDPTDTDNDGVINARTGTTGTNVIITSASEVIVRARGENDAGNLGPVKQTRLDRLTATSAIGVFERIDLDYGQQGSETEEAFELKAILGPDAVGPFSYIWRNPLSSEADEEDWHSDNGQGAWSTARSETSEGVVDFTGITGQDILVTRGQGGAGGIMQVRVRDEGIGPPHPEAFQALEVRTYESVTGQGLGVIVTNTDPGEATTDEPKGTLWAYYS